MARRPHTAADRDFAALWIGQTVNELGSRTSLFVLPLLLFALTGSTALAALGEAVHLLGMTAALLPAGVLADRLHRGRVMRLTSGLGALLDASLVVAGLAGHLTLPHLLTVALLTGVCAGVFSPVETSAVRTVVDDDGLPAALAANQARQNVASLVGGPLGGALYGLTRWLPFAADAMTYATSFVLLGTVRTDLSPVERNGARTSLRRDLTDGFRFVVRRPLFRVLMAWSALANLAINALLFAATLRLITAGFPAWQIGLVETAAGVSGVVGAVIAPWLIERCRTGRLTVLAAWSFVPLVVPLVVWNQPIVVAAALACGMLLNPAGNAGIGAYRMAVTPPELVGRVQSTSQFVSMSVMPLAPVAAGLALAGLGGPLAMAVLGALTAGVALIPTLSHVVREVPRPAQWRAALTAAA